MCCFNYHNKGCSVVLNKCCLLLRLPLPGLLGCSEQVLSVAGWVLQEFDPHDAVFPANRAMAQLKMKRYGEYQRCSIGVCNLPWVNECCGVICPGLVSAAALPLPTQAFT